MKTKIKQLLCSHKNHKSLYNFVDNRWTYYRCNDCNANLIGEKNNKKYLELLYLFLTGFSQIYFVAINTLFLMQGNYIAVLTTSFIISLIWSYNVKKIAFGSTKERITYALGASIGGVAGLWSSAQLIKLL
jgi:hypothetical protein